MTQLGGSESSCLYHRTAPPSASARWSEALPGFMASVAVHETAALTASAIAEELVATVGARGAAVHFADPDERTLRLVASCNMPGSPIELRLVDANTGEPAACAARSRLLFLASSGGRSDGTLFAVPMLCGARLLGAVTCELPARLEPREFASLDALGVVLGALVDRTRRQEDCRARSEWTSLVAHELRQPLNALCMHASVLRSEQQEEAGVASPAVRRIGESVTRLNGLIGDLTNASLIDVNRIQLSRRPTDLVKLTRELADASGHPAESLQIEVRGDIPVLDLDARRMGQVLSNLFDNARKHTQGDAPVRIVLERCGAEVVVAVTNRGPSIDERQQARLFERYYRADPTRTDGLGVGLYVCRGLVEAHGGTVSVASRDGSTTFSVQLPVPLGLARTSPGSAVSVQVWPRAVITT